MSAAQSNVSFSDKCVRQKACSAAVVCTNSIVCGRIVCAALWGCFSARMALRKSEKRHQSLKRLAKLGKKAQAEANKEKAKMDALLASVGISRDTLN